MVSDSSNPAANNPESSGKNTYRDRYAMDLSDKVAVVTGGASGIGLATCQCLMHDDLRAIGVVDQCETVTEVCGRLNEEVGRELFVPYVGNVTDAEFRRRVFRDLSSRFEVVQMCIPAAGITRDALSVKLDRANSQARIYPQEDFEAVLRINLIAPIYWALETVASVAEWRAKKGLGRWGPDEAPQGSIVLIGSVSSAGNKGQISYATAKRGLEGAQATLAKEAIFHGMRCCIIHPGFTDTPMVRVMGDEYIRQNILPQTQLRRLLSPAEVADSIRFMLRSTGVSGSLWVDAGWHPAA